MSGRSTDSAGSDADAGDKGVDAVDDDRSAQRSD
jgi:hypothetical protein